MLEIKGRGGNEEDGRRRREGGGGKEEGGRQIGGDQLAMHTWAPLVRTNDSTVQQV